jgi:hypothetical protein
LSKIEEFLKKKDKGTELIHDLDRIKEKVGPFLLEINEIFPEYTSHDISHSERILEKFDFLIPDSLFEKMNSYELYFLIASAYFHDIGMVNFPDLLEPEFEKLTGENNKKLQEIIRERHHLRSETICIKKYNDYSIDDFHQAAIIGRICRGHRKEDLHSTLFRPDEVYKSYPINVSLLASLLRNGDELDLTFERTPYVIYENVPPRDKISKDEWEKHLRISGITVDPDDKQIIKCSARCENPKIHRLLKALEIKVNKGIEDLPSHLHQYREVKRDIPRKIIINIESVGYEPYDFKFSLQEIEILNLLMGDRLYERKEECLRELLKNAVDACRMRKFRTAKEGEPYTPIIKFELNSDELIITDNGIGMDKYIIENYFTKIGKSFYKSEEFIEESCDFSPVNELGIGVLSYFMIANKISIETKAEEEDAISLEIDDFSGYFFVKKGNMKRPGTKINLSLKKEAKGIDLEKEIKLFASHLGFPIKVLSQGREISIKEEDFLSNELLIKTEILKRIAPVVQSHSVNGFTNNSNSLIELQSVLEELFQSFQLKTHMLEIKEASIVGKIGFLMVGKHYFENICFSKLLQAIFNVSLSIHIDTSVHIISLDPLEGISRISYSGIHVCFEKFSVPWFNSILLLDLNLKENILDLNVARNKCILNEKKEKFNDFIESNLLKCIKDFLDTLRCESNFPRLAYTFINIFMNFENKLKIREKMDFKSFLNEYYYLKEITEYGVSYLSYDDNIFKTDKKIVLLTDVPLDSDLENILPNVCGFEENTIYFVYTKNLYNLIYYFIKNREKIELITFCELLGREITDVIEVLKEENADNKIQFRKNVSKYENVFINKFTNFNFSKYIGFYERGGFDFNVEHKFINFVIKNRGKISRDDELFSEFMLKFEVDPCSRSVDSIISLQRKLLSSWFEKGFISETDFDNLILSKEDFVMYPQGLNF